MNMKEIGAVLALLKRKAVEQVPGAVDDWLDDHPEATTTVEDGAITYAKLDSNLKEEVDQVSELKSALSSPTRNILDFHKMYTGNYQGVDYKIVNGKYLVDGTATGSWTNYSDDLQLTPGQTYTFCAFSDTDINISGYIKTTDSGNNQLQKVDITSTNTPVTITIDANTTKTVWSFGLKNGVEYDDYEFRFQCVKGSSIGNYIPYITATDFEAREIIQKNSSDIEDIHDGLIELDSSVFVTGFEPTPFDSSAWGHEISGYDTGSGSIVTSTAYITKDFVATKDFELYLDDYETVPYISIVLYANGTRQSGNQKNYARHRTSGSDTNVPTSASKMSVSVGDLVSVSVMTVSSAQLITPVFSMSKLYTNYRSLYGLILNKNIILPEDMAGSYVILSADKIRITCGRITYVLEHEVNNGANLDTYRITSAGIGDDTNLFTASDIEGPIKEIGASDFVGGLHGDEKYTSITMLVDSKAKSLTAQAETKYRTIDVFVTSTLYFADHNTDACFTRYKHLHFDSDGLEISNRLVCLSDFLCQRYTGCGIFSIYNSRLNGYVANIYKTLDHPDTTQTTAQVIIPVNSDYNKMLYVGTDYEIEIIPTENNYPDYYKGWLQGFFADADPRIKVYFDAIYGQADGDHPGGVPIATGDTILASYKIVSR